MHKIFSLAMLAYVASVVLVNIGFSYVPPIPTPLGMFAPMAIFVGGVFIIRDFAQRASGHFVLVGMIVATFASYFLADPHVALASAAAFAASELIDWAVYSATKRPFHQRVAISSLFAVPVDTAVFLLGIGFMHTGTFVIMVLSKLVALSVVWLMRPTDTREPAWDV
jgi:uncharacterized PurR-regulated membrane protein YhhQ (DUF165 family)